MNLLSSYRLDVAKIYRNPTPAFIYEKALTSPTEKAKLTSTGALVAYSGEKTGRSPKDKRIVQNPASQKDIWWGDINIPMEERSFLINRERVIDYLNTKEELYVIDGFAGWDPEYRIKVRVICSRPYHALFMHNMLIRPTKEELQEFGEPDYVVFNGGSFPANQLTNQMTSKTSVSLSFERKEFIILGTDYAGEMKKGVFTIMNYLMPKQGVLSMHCSANVGKNEDLSLFFGLSGTGKTTLSTEHDRELIGDDEHCWTDKGIFNIEGGCYAKCSDLSAEKEPEIFSSIRFGALLENVVFDPDTREVDYKNLSITQNTRCSYPIEYIENAKIPCVGPLPKNIILLTCDAFGVLPPVSRLSPDEAQYHFISGYTAKIAGTEQGVTEPEATFSACFGAAFMVWHPGKYAELLAKKMKAAGCQAWLVNTGWSGGAYGVGKRMDLKITRKIIDAIHTDTIGEAGFEREASLGFEVPKAIQNIPSEILKPRLTWTDKTAYDQTALRLSQLFEKNFKQFEDGITPSVKNSGPRALKSSASTNESLSRLSAEA